ncbi:AraC family transcriptional regulator [Massilia aquatica]|uniref:AraC family transcriptional regulator n=1 Tax=Massilia aquatica TaxID=2609000 RepID=A0ABX0LX59_9BURK|nr:AraC family transcriptional regulator [Massilia aquatica]NHZ39395.1 AraC family transcriptional regulator [Massilia aquatica]
MEKALKELRAIVMRADDTWTATGLPRVAMVRAEACSDQVYHPMVHLVLQGFKSLSIGEQILRFVPATYFVVPVDLPALGQVSGDAPGETYLALSLALDPGVIAAVLADLGETDDAGDGKSFMVSAAGPELIDAWLRMMRLIGRPPREVALLAPMIEREILLRVLQGAQGNMLRQLAHPDTRLSQVRRAIDWIRGHVVEPFRVEPLAAMAGMSVATFYRHFRAVTAMTPIQYQKRLRLLKARRQLLFEPHNAASVAFSVGYESASQFSREYARMFGMPPARDVARFKAPRVPPTVSLSAGPESGAGPETTSRR